MNILFLALHDFESLDERHIYTDLLREFWRNGHNIYAISPTERKSNKATYILHTDKADILKPRILNMQKTNYIEKTLSLITIENIIIKSIQKYFSNIRFDLVLYVTPPVTFQEAINYVKKRDNAVTYLLQKDIFPESAVDLGALTKTGWKGLVYNYFRKKEVELLKVSDYIGCMSPANVEYIKTHNNFLRTSQIEVCPNSIEVIDESINENNKVAIRAKYGLPLDNKVFIYGGNLGKPQGIPFLIKCLEKAKKMQGVFFLIVGSGTEYGLLEKYAIKEKKTNFKLMRSLPKKDYDDVVRACDVGMIFLDYRFTTPNFPSRLLSYMQAKLPVLAATDRHTDIGKIISNEKFGYWCESNDTNSFIACVEKFKEENCLKMGHRAFEILNEQYSVKQSYKIIVSHF